MKMPRALLAAIAAIAMLAVNAAPAFAALTGVSAYAYGEQVRFTLLGGTTVSSGPTPTVGPIAPSGGSASSTLLSASVPGLLTTGVLTVAVNGSTASGSVTSSATVNDVSALGGVFTATGVQAECAVNNHGDTSGSTTLASAVLAGQSLSANPGPNTTVAFSTLAASGYVVLNEQTYNAATNTLTVNAVHLYVTGGTLGTGDIVISHVECGAVPGGAAPIIPEAPLALLLPLTALAVFGGAIFLSTRRGPATLRLGR